MAKSYPKVILIGKGRGKMVSETKELLNAIEPSNIPSNMIDQLIIETTSGTRYKIDERFLTEGVAYDKIENHLRDIGMREPIESIELTIDLDATRRVIESQTNNLLDQFFDN